MARLDLQKRIPPPVTATVTAPVVEKKENIWNRDIQIGPAVSPKDKRQFFQLLGILLESGLSITEAFSILIGQTKKKKFASVLASLQQWLQEGITLSAAMKRFPKYFSSFEVFTVKMGEDSGNIVRVLNDLGVYHEKRIRLQRKFTQALSYPIAVLMIAGAVLSFMIAFVVPMFEDSFRRFDAELPGITKMVLSVSSFARNWGLMILIAAAVGVFLLIRFKESAPVKRTLSGIGMRLPLIGGLLLKIQLSRFCYSLGLMLRSKVNLDQALELLEQVTTYYPLQRTVGEIRRDVVEGSTIYDAFSRHSVYPPVMLQMVKVGERTARLDQMMDNLARTMEEEGETAIGSLTSLLEPLLIVLLGIIVGGILLAMYLPMFAMSGHVQ